MRSFEPRRYLAGPAFSFQEVRGVAWEEILRLLRTPELIRAELERRRAESLNSSPLQQRHEQVKREVTRLGQQMDKLLDAYQEGLLTLADLRRRVPELKQKIGGLEKEQQNLQLRAVENKRWIELSNSMESFLGRLNENAKKMDAVEKQKVVRTVVKQITVGNDVVTIHHSIPLGTACARDTPSSYPLCTRSHHRSLRRPLFGRFPALQAVHHSRFQVLFQQGQQAPVTHPFFDSRQQRVMRNGVEVALEVGVHHPGVSALQQAIHPSQRVFAAPSGPKPVTVFGKFALEDGFQHVPNCPLHDPIPDRRNTPSKLHSAPINLWDGPLSPIRFTRCQENGFES